MPKRTFHIVGVPLRSGSFMPGTESDAPAYREAGLVDRLRSTGNEAVDDGDLDIPSYLPHHTVPPVRNWPGPRIVWDLLVERIEPILAQPGHVPLLIGCDCSVVVGTAQSLTHAADNVHVLYIDGDFDDAPPDPAHCQSAAAIAVWLLTNPSPFWAGPLLRPSQIMVVGWSKPSHCLVPGVNSVSLADVRGQGATQIAEHIRAAIPPTAAILVHFDVDVLADDEFPVAYFPHSEGMTRVQVGEVLSSVLADERVRIIEISEYSALRDLDRIWVRRLIDIFAAALTDNEKVASDNVDQ